ncbi:MAG: PLP-dependent aminotransferase family protein [Lachnospiraceae bacterium]|jgi:GntR family transcriptional regulator/MocR family aminotransferase|nr:PLP-dependent aminotransferase family protein [Lachnospiraceae bacterium]NBJ80573.1 PLP-dependent aminotransferase family protein [bacterium 1XD42-76]NBK03782.1 PLP-dependent aminotransferase family protein [bacterium 1XD42-94]
MELLIPLNLQDSKPLYEQIYQYIKDEIRRGNMKPDRQLPSSRELAKSLKVSRSTTQLAYEQLVSEGYLEAVPRKGYFTARLDGLLPSLHAPGYEEGGTEADVPDLLSNRTEEGEHVQVDFSPGGIDLERFPFSTWRKISRAVLREEEKEVFLKGDPQGDLPLREAIRDYLHAARGVNCHAFQIVVGAGNEYLLMLLSQLLGNTTGIAMENPTYMQAYRVLSGMGHPVVPVDMDGSGIRTDILESLPADVAYVMPSHQFPMGIVMPVRRRQELLSWAAKKEGRYIIEDDYDSEFRYKGKPIPALQGMDRCGRVIYMGTFSKSIAPAIRIGYLVLPLPLLSLYEKQARFYSSTVSRVDQRILSQFIMGGYFERHLNRMRETYKGKLEALLTSLKPLEPYFAIKGEHAGLHVLMTHQGERTEEELERLAATAGIRVYGLSGFYIHKEPIRDPRTVILGYARLSEAEIYYGAQRLSEIWR